MISRIPSRSWILTILQVHLHRRSIGRFAHPNIKILAFSGLEKEHVVAVVQIGKLVELIELRLGIQLRIFAAVGKKRVEIVEEMPMPEEVSYGWGDCFLLACK